MKVKFIVSEEGNKESMFDVDFPVGATLPIAGEIRHLSNVKMRINSIKYNVASGDVTLVAFTTATQIAEDIVKITSTESLAEILRTHKEVMVTFTKKDGSKRVMKATLHKDIINPLFEGRDITDIEKVLEDARRKLSMGLVVVYDNEAQSWRSFKFDSIISVEYPDETGNSKISAVI